MAWSETGDTSTTNSQTISVTASAGQLLVLFIGWGDITSTLTVSDGVNVWNATPPQRSSGSAITPCSVQMFYAANVVAGTHVVTASSFPVSLFMICYLFSGYTTAGLDGLVVGTNTTSSSMTATSNSITTLGGSDLIVAGWMDLHDSGATSVASPFTLGNSGGGFYPAYALNEVAGSYTPTFTFGGGLSWAMVAAAFYSTPILPVVTTQSPIADSSGVSCVGRGNITATGLATPTTQGFVYGTVNDGVPGNVAPGSSGWVNYVTQSGTYSTGPFTESITGLTPFTQYYISAWAQNSYGYSYGPVQSFKIVTGPFPVFRPDLP